MTVLAAAAPATSAWDQPGTLGFLVVFGMGVILFFVFRSMSRHLKKVNAAAAYEAKLHVGPGADDPQQDERGNGSAVGPAAGNSSRSGSGPL